MLHPYNDDPNIYYKYVAQTSTAVPISQLRIALAKRFKVLLDPKLNYAQMAFRHDSRSLESLTATKTTYANTVSGADARIGNKRRRPSVTAKDVDMDEPHSQQRRDTVPPESLDYAAHILLCFGFASDSTKREWLTANETELCSLILSSYVARLSSAVEFQNLVDSLSLNSLVSLVPTVSILTEGRLKRGGPGREGPDVCLRMKFQDAPFPFFTHGILIGGFIHVHGDFLPDIVAYRLKKRMEHLMDTAKLKPGIISHTVGRHQVLGDWVNSLSKVDVFSLGSRATDSSNSSVVVDDPITLEEIAKRVNAIPLCMKSVLDYEEKYGSLKYEARIQLWPFLKDVGLSLEQQMVFHRRFFKDQKKFESEFRYTLRHMYGMEGKKIEKQCYTCPKIAGSTQASTQSSTGSGCPFRNRKPNELRTILDSHGIQSFDIESILSDCGKGQNEGACRTYLGAMFGLQPNDVPVFASPVQFFSHYRKLQKQKTVTPTTSTEP